MSNIAQKMEQREIITVRPRFYFYQPSDLITGKHQLKEFLRNYYSA